MKFQKPKPKPDLTSEVSLGFSFSDPRAVVIGVDEVGRGCLAGPVVAAASAWLASDLRSLFFLESGQRIESKRDHLQATVLDRVQDSKLIPEKDRAPIRDAILKASLVTEVAEASVEEIAQWNILGASHLAMERALAAVQKKLAQKFAEKFGSGSHPPSPLILIDGNLLPKSLRSQPQVHPLVKGDQKSFPIACASIVAKVARDQAMAVLDERFPGYGLAQHKGYPTPFHKAQIQKLGITSEHRLGFRGVSPS